MNRGLQTFFFVLALWPVASAEVSLKNGNFFTGAEDLKYPGGFEPKVERVYNSKASFSGHFGFGWGWEYEVYLDPTPEGGAVVHEYGGGATNYFVPDNRNDATVRETAERLLKVAIRLREVQGAEAQQRMLERLQEDIEYRQSLFERFRKLKEIDAPATAVGTTMRSERFSHQVIARVASGYRREYDNGRTEYFDTQGRLTRVTDRNGNFVQLSYDVRNRIRMLDNFGRLITLYLNDANLVRRVEAQGGRWAAYAYDDAKNLIYARDEDGGVLEYSYDPRHNLTEIKYPDGTSMKLSYYPVEKYENVRSLKDRDGTLTEYSYDLDPKDHGHYAVTLSVSGANGERVSKSRYEYFNKTVGLGEFTARMITDIDGDVTDTTYQPETSLPLSINHNGKETKFVYDQWGHVLRKETPDEITELEYSPTVHKVTQVCRQTKYESSERSCGKFEYDPQGNLLNASDGTTSVSLEYDTAGRIAAMRSGQKRVEFVYNSMSKPEKITMIESGKQTGFIIVHYGPSGTIEKVDSPQGRQVALGVTSAFQQLLDLIRPAGVTLNF